MFISKKYGKTKTHGFSDGVYSLLALGISLTHEHSCVRHLSIFMVEMRARG